MSTVDPQVWEQAMNVLQEIAAGGGQCPLCGNSLNGVCFSCDSEIPEGANYCSGCGMRVGPYPATCDECGALTSDATVCPQCGAPCGESETEDD